ncbi:MAG: magnesium/cobalt transporter CorA [Bacteroidia bacterium]|nr:magnesium/cobalt transporter CorA [Bacteroidia bacterium]
MENKEVISNVSKEGLAPGTLLYTGTPNSDKVKITAITYNGEESSVVELRTLSQIANYPLEGQVTWINVDGVHQPEIVEAIGNHFGLHQLVMEDILNTRQRPKAEDYGEYIYFVIRMLDFEKGGKEDELTREQVSIILGKNFVISFQEKTGDVFDKIRARIRERKGREVKMGADYLAYLLLDSVVDHYFRILEVMGQKIDEMEAEMIRNPGNDTLQEIFSIKRELIFLRESVSPLRETVSTFTRLQNSLISQDIAVYLRDFTDHVMRVIETVETYRDTTSSMVDLYLSTTSIKMNEVIKVLTVISTIFIPLTFITGFYGMNLDFMPEVHSQWTYPGVIVAMAVMVVLQLIWFRKKRWI